MMVAVISPMKFDIWHGKLKEKFPPWN